MRRPPKVPRPTPVPRVPTPAVAFDAAEQLPILTASSTPGRLLVTFAHHAPGAAAVLLFANRLTDETSLADTLLEPAAGGWWHATFEMAADWRASYAFLVAEAGVRPPWASEGADGGDQVALRAALDRGVADPRNPHTCRNRAGAVQSVVSLPDAPAQPWLAPRPDVAAGAVREVAGPDGRPVWLYSTPGTPSGPLPLVVALDGEVWTGSQDLPTTLDNLHADGAIGALRAVLPSSGGREARWAELGVDGGVAWLTDELLPWARGRFEPTADRVVVCGQSLGGLTALRAGLQRPDVVAAAVSQSASLWLDDLLDRVAALPPDHDLRVHLAHGAQEWVLTGPHQAFSDALRTAAVDHVALEVNGGHDYAWWRGTIADGLRWALAPSQPSQPSQ